VIRLLLIGAPGAGKGTQAVKLAEAYSIPAISTGDIFRHNVKNETELGKQAKAFMDRGEYVPDSLTNDLVRDRLSQADAKAGFLLDGYPRTAEQVAELDSILEAEGSQLDAVVQLTADTDEVVRRLLNRAIEQGRADDTEDVIRRRLEVYEEQTAPLTNVYAKRGLLITVDGLGEVEAVTGRILEALHARTGAN
jgi:adenylate kinase